MKTSSIKSVPRPRRPGFRFMLGAARKLCSMTAGDLSVLFLSAVLMGLGMSAARSYADERPRARELGITPGTLSPGRWNAITDVPGVLVGHVTYRAEPGVRTGATAILPRVGNMFQRKVPAAIVVANGFGKLIGLTQVNELGQLETPILLTNTLNVWEAATALVDHTLAMRGNEVVFSVNPVVGETNDGYLNDIRSRPLKADHFKKALDIAATGPVAEGSVGAGTGTTTMGFKGGIGTSSRRVDVGGASFLVGVLTQTNFDGSLTIAGAPVGKELRAALESKKPTAGRDGSCMIVVATDAPLDARQLRRLGSRTLVGMARTGANFSHGSGDYVIAFSTAESMAIPHAPAEAVRDASAFSEPMLTPLFEAAADATEEAIYNALLRATTIHGRQGHVAEAIPLEPLKRALRDHGVE